VSTSTLAGQLLLGIALLKYLKKRVMLYRTGGFKCLSYLANGKEVAT